MSKTGKEPQGVIYFKLKSDYQGDSTKNCGLLGNEVDENFYFLRGYDIETAYTENIDDRKFLVLERLNGQKIKADITDTDFVYSFVVRDGVIYVTLPDGSEEPFRDEEGNPVKFLVEGDGVTLASDFTIQGDGTVGNPFGIDLAYRTGTFAPAQFFLDISCGEELPSVEEMGIEPGDAIITQEKTSPFGALYAFSQADLMNKALAKEGNGWRLPSREDWAKLLNWAEPNPADRNHDSTESGEFGCIAGARLKSIELWAGNANTNNYDFTAYPVGVYNQIGSVVELDGLYSATTFWSSTKINNEAYVRTFTCNTDSVFQSTSPLVDRLSIRLVKDVKLEDVNLQGFASILGEKVPVILTTDGKQLWTKVNVSLTNYSGYDSNEITIPSEWGDIDTDFETKKYYELVDGKYVEIDEYDLPSYAEPVEVEEVPEEPEFDAPDFVFVVVDVHCDFLNKTSLFYCAWDGNTWHKRELKPGESLVILGEDYPSECTGATEYVTDENLGHNWRVCIDDETGNCFLLDPLEPVRHEFWREINRIDDEISALTEDLITLSGDVVNYVNEEIEALSGNVLDYINEEIEALSGNVIDYVDESIETLSGNVLDYVNEEIETLSGNILNYINEEIESLSGNVLDYVNEEIETLSGNVLDYVNEEIETTLNYVDEEIETLSGNVLEFVNEEIDSLSGNVLDYVDESVEALSGNVLDYVNEEIESLSGSVIEYVNEEIETLSGNVIDYTDESVTALSGNIIEYVDEAAWVASAALNDLNDRANATNEELAGFENATNSRLEALEAKEIVPEDDSITVNKIGSRTSIGVKLDPEESHIKLGDNGLYFDGDFVTFQAEPED